MIDRSRKVKTMYLYHLLRFYSSCASVQHVPVCVIGEKLAKVWITTETFCRECAMCSLNTDESPPDQRAFLSQGCYKHNHTMLCVGPRHGYPLQPRWIHWHDDNYMIRASVLAWWGVSYNIEMYEMPAVMPSWNWFYFTHKDGGMALWIQFRQVLSCKKKKPKKNRCWYDMA